MTTTMCEAVPTTNINTIVGKRLQMEVGSDVLLKVMVISDKTIAYQFMNKDRTYKDDVVITKLEIMYDDIESIYDYSFSDGIASRFYLFQFSEE